MAKTSLEAEESFMNSITKSGKLRAEKSFRPVIVAQRGFYAKKPLQNLLDFKKKSANQLAVLNDASQGSKLEKYFFLIGESSRGTSLRSIFSND